MALKLITVAVIFIAVFHDSRAQVSRIGICPKGIKAKADFNSANFGGVWYEVKRYPTIQIMGRCVSINYKSDTKGAKITTTQVMPGMNTTASESVNGFDKGSGKWSYKTTLGLGMKF